MCNYNFAVKFLFDNRGKVIYVHGFVLSNCIINYKEGSFFLFDHRCLKLLKYFSHTRLRERRYYFAVYFFFFFILLTHEGSIPGRSTRNSNPVMTSSAGPVPRVVQTTGSVHSPSLHCPIANSASTQSQQPVIRTGIQI